MANQVTETRTTTEAPKKKNKIFPIVLLALVAGGAWFGITKYTHGKHHEETDNAHIEANISPVIPRIGGYIADIRVQDNAHVKKGDTLVVLDDRDLRLKVQRNSNMSRPWQQSKPQNVSYVFWKNNDSRLHRKRRQ
jgi:membrane fusion protein (multidrug efflux system)